MLEFLQGLALFLNTVHPMATEKEWRSFRKRIEKNVIGSYFYSHTTSLTLRGPRPDPRKTGKVERVTLDEAKDIRAEMHHDALAYLRSKEELDWPYAALVCALNDLKLVNQYQCFPETGKPRPGQAILHSHGKRWAGQFWPIATTTKELLYTILGAALVDGTLNRLRVCLQCGKYVVVKHGRRKFCPNSNKCKDDYNNKRRLAEGYFRQNRRLRLAKARRLQG